MLKYSVKLNQHRILHASFCVYKERDSIIDESERLTALLSTAKEDVVKVSELLERTDKEKRRLQEKNAKLTITGELNCLLFKSASCDP